MWGGKKGLEGNLSTCWLSKEKSEKVGSCVSVYLRSFSAVLAAVLWSINLKMSLTVLVIGLMTSCVSTALTHRSPEEAGPHHLGDRCVLGAATVAGYRHLCCVCFSCWSVSSDLRRSHLQLDETFCIACVSVTNLRLSSTSGVER